MKTRILSIAFRFGLPFLGFALIIAFSTLFKRAFSFSFDLTILVIALLIATARYMGRGPGIFIALAFEAALLYFSPPAQLTGRAAFVTVNRLALFVSLALFASARRRSEQKLREQRELLQVTLESIGDAVIAAGADGRINFINSTAEALTGWKSADAAGRPLTEIFRIIGEETRRPVEISLTAVIRSGALAGLAGRPLLVTRDGREIPIEMSGAPIRDAKGKTIGVILVFHDVSERRRAEFEREALLESERLARQEAETAGRLKDEFLATVSHELRTPLSAILGWATMLKNRHLAESKAPRALEIIERNAKAQGEIINDLLDVSQITTGKLTLDRQPVEIGPLVEAAAESLRPQTLAKEIALTVTVDAPEAFVVGDAARLRQIVWNLLSNAVKFTPAGGVIEVRAARAGDSVEIVVADSGIGIDEEFLPYIFDKFRQADASPTRPHGGLGLGLAIVRDLVGLHGGEISVHSAGAERGATFTVRLPLAENQSRRSAGSAS